MSGHVHDLAIVIISYNTRDITRDCLRSVFDNLGGLDAKVYVVDNKSRDGSADMVAAEFPQVELVRNPDNRGFATANNQALLTGTARYHLLLNSDTVVLGSVLQDSIRFMDEHEKVGVFGCRVLNPDKTMQATCFMEPTHVNLLLKLTGLFKSGGPMAGVLGREHYADWKRDSERDVDVVTGCYMLVRDSAMSEVGLLDEDYFFCGEETDWCRRFREAGWGVRFAPVGEIIHLGNASGRSLSFRRDLLLTRGLLTFHRKHSGFAGFVFAWVLLWLFNFSRGVLWTVVGMLSRKGAHQDRGRHFFSLIGHFDEARPGKPLKSLG